MLAKTCTIGWPRSALTQLVRCDSRDLSERGGTQVYASYQYLKQARVGGKGSVARCPFHARTRNTRRNCEQQLDGVRHAHQRPCRCLNTEYNMPITRSVPPTSSLAMHQPKTDCLTIGRVHDDVLRQPRVVDNSLANNPHAIQTANVIDTKDPKATNNHEAARTVGEPADSSAVVTPPGPGLIAPLTTSE